jgi:glycosyltransferase involved in cell wall biosynthesis
MKKSRSRSRAPGERRRPTISVCVIARNEEQFIGDCLASARPFVDEVLVLDTGSTDRTIEIARAAGARVETFAWQDDFGAARNAAIDLATSDWILMLDADERLQPASGPALRAFVDGRPTGAPFYAPRIDNRTGDGPEDFRISFPNRLFRRVPELRYVGTIHEDLVYLGNPARSLGLRLDQIRITHLGYLADVVQARGKFERNWRLLQREASARPDDPLPWYYMGMDRVAADEPAEAAEYFRQSLARSGNRPNWTAIVEVYAQLVWAYTRLKDDDRLRAVVAAAEHAGKLSAGARCHMAEYLVERELYAEAVQHLLAALAPDQPLVQVNRPGIGGWLTRLDLARLYEHMANAAAALEQLELVLADPAAQERGEIAKSAVRLAAQVGDMASLARCLDAVTEPREDDLEGTLRILELRAAARPSERSLRVLNPTDQAITRGDWPSAHAAALRLSGRTMGDAARVLFVAAHFEGNGEPAAALQLLEHLYDAQPALPQLHFVLTKVLADLGRYDDALAANQILQQLVAANQAA